MWRRLFDWLDDRIGYRQLKQLTVLKDLACSASWRYVWGGCLSFLFLIQVLTGILLMLAYSPGNTTAWGSVFFIQYELDFGWLIRGLHHFAAQAFIVLLFVYLIHMALAGMHLPPGEAVWWAALLLLGLVVANDLTGNPLPWDQKGFWALQVELNIIASVPGLGPFVQRWVLGGSEAGHLTLTRLFALHVVVLPALIAVLLLLHHVAVRRYLLRQETVSGDLDASSRYRWRKALARLILLMLLTGLCFVPWAHPLDSSGHAAGKKVHADNPASSSWWSQIAHLGRWGYGAPLDSPADPSREYPIARPKWTYWFLFQFRKSVEGSWASWATVFGPLLVGLILFVLPLLGHGRGRKPIHVASVLIMIGLAVGIAWLTAQTWWNDYGPSPAAEKFQEELRKQRALAERAVHLASRGIPAEGAPELLRRDPLTRGRELYQLHCASCHSFGPAIQSKAPVAPDLQGFGTAEWIYQLLQRMRDPESVESKILPQMASWVRREYERAARADDRARKAGENPRATEQLESDLRRIADWLATHPRRRVPQEGPELEAFQKDTSPFAQGYRAYETHCLRCHVYAGSGGGDTNGPDLTGYGDAEWLRGLLHAPFDRHYYGPSVVRWSRAAGERYWMPAFREMEGANALLGHRDLERTLQELESLIPEDDPQREKRLQVIRRACRWVHLQNWERELIIRFVLGDDRLVLEGADQE